MLRIYVYEMVDLDNIVRGLMGWVVVMIAARGGVAHYDVDDGVDAAVKVEVEVEVEVEQ